ncbi:MAG: class II fructose-bisphosphate aldolase [Trueperaceae bacterium]|nr:class II fructose-bisphosphate aldolase [Trueperaceae bacterium]
MALQQAAYAVAAAPASEAAGLAAGLLAECARLGVAPAPVGTVYRALAEGRIAPLTVPAFNVRGLTFDVVSAIYRRATEQDAAGVMFELAPSEAAVADQSFAQYAALVCAAAAVTGYRGPVLVQGDHFSVEEAADAVRVESLARDALASGFLQIDLDAAALAEEGASAAARQGRNAAVTAGLMARLAPHAPAGTIFGGEVGEIGGANTTPEELDVFVDLVRRHAGAAAGLFGKVSVQTGTRHGGVTDAAGRKARMPLDTGLARELADVARAKGLPGIVQHGASTLQRDQFAALPGCGVVEVHLATNLQDLVFDSPAFPPELRAELVAAALGSSVGAAERGADTSGVGDQLFRQRRWSLWGPFKRRLLDLPAETRASLAAGVADWAGELLVAFGLAGRAAEIRGLYADAAASDG